MVDFLLAFENPQVFSSFAINAHDFRHGSLSLTEQVSGRQGKICFQLYIDKNTIGLLLTKLKANFSGSGLHYWVTPIIDHGTI